MATSLKHSRKRPWHFERPRSALPRRRRVYNVDDGEPVVLRLVEFEITDEPIDDPWLDRTPQRDRERILHAGARVIDGATDQVEVLEGLVEEFPGIPKVYNYLACAYRNAGLTKKMEALVERTYRRFPDYLFAVTNYVQLLLRRYRIDEASGVLAGRYSLDLWIPDRRRYHVSEFVAFNSMMVWYFAELGEEEIALRYYQMLREAAPDHPATLVAEACFSAGTIRRVLRWLNRKAHDSASGQSQRRR